MATAKGKNSKSVKSAKKAKPAAAKAKKSVSRKPKAKREIEIIYGNENPNILVIAPHDGNSGNEGTGILARSIGDGLSCHAIINGSYIIPEKKEDGTNGDLDLKEFKADLSCIDHAKEHTKYIDEITKMLSGQENAYVFWIHGINDDDLSAESEKYGYGEAKCLVGYGQGEGNGNSIEPSKAGNFVKILTEKDLSSVETNGESADFRGASPNHMNQFFKINNDKFTGVESVELRFAKKDVRGGWDSKKTAVKVARAIAELVGCKAVNLSEEKADDELVKEATEKVMEFIDSNYKNNVAVGHYLIEKFYGNDYEKAKKGQKVKGESLHKMLDEIQKEGNAPSKSWFYNAVNLAVDDKEFEGDADYPKLNLSHKIYLTYLNKKDEWNSAKLGLVKEIAKDGMSIEDLTKRIAEIKGKSINELPDPDQIASMDDKDKDRYKKKAVKLKEKLEEQLKALQEELDKCDKIIKAVDGVSEDTVSEEQITGTDG